MPTPAGAPPRTGTKSPSPRTSSALSCCTQRPPRPPASSCAFGGPSSSASWPLSAPWHGSPACSHSSGQGTPDAPRLRQNHGLRGPAVRAQRVPYATPVPHRLHGADGLDRGGLYRSGALRLRTLERHGLVPAVVRRRSLPRYVPAPVALGLRPGDYAGRRLPWKCLPLRHRRGLLAGSGHAVLDGVAAVRKPRVRAHRRHRLLADFAHLPAGCVGPRGFGRVLGPAPAAHAGGVGGGHRLTSRLGR